METGFNGAAPPFEGYGVEREPTAAAAGFNPGAPPFEGYGVQREPTAAAAPPPRIVDPWSAEAAIPRYEHPSAAAAPAADLAAAAEFIARRRAEQAAIDSAMSWSCATPAPSAAALPVAYGHGAIEAIGLSKPSIGMSKPRPNALTAEECHSIAKGEGLALLRAGGATGYKFVYNCSKPFKPFQAKVKINIAPQRTHQEHLGYFATAEEAALAVARRLGPLAPTTQAEITQVVSASAAERIQKRQKELAAQEAERASCQRQLEATAALRAGAAAAEGAAAVSWCRANPRPAVLAHAPAGYVSRAGLYQRAPAHPAERMYQRREPVLQPIAEPAPRMSAEHRDALLRDAGLPAPRMSAEHRDALLRDAGFGVPAELDPPPPAAQAMTAGYWVPGDPMVQQQFMHEPPEAAEPIVYAPRAAAVAPMVHEVSTHGYDESAPGGPREAEALRQWTAGALEEARTAAAADAAAADAAERARAAGIQSALTSNFGGLPPVEEAGTNFPELEGLAQLCASPASGAA